MPDGINVMVYFKPGERMSIIESDTGILGKRKSEKEICISISDERLKSLYNFVVILGNCAFLAFY